MKPKKAAALRYLSEEARLLSDAWDAMRAEIHRGEALTAAQRQLMQLLATGGGRTMPELARARGVSRQHVRALVQPLLEAGWVRLAANPAHRRSPQVELSTLGREGADEMERREARHLEHLDLDASRGDLERAARVIAALRGRLRRSDRGVRAREYPPSHVGSPPMEGST